VSVAFYRTKKAGIYQMVNLTLLSTSAAYFISSYKMTGFGYELFLGALFGLWAMFVLWHFLTKRLLFLETVEGFIFRGLIRQKFIRWDQLVAIGDPDISSKMIFLVWKSDDREKERYVALTHRNLGAENCDTIRALILKKRPKLATYRQGKVHDAL